MPSAKITTTTPFADYTFRLKATNQQGDSAWSMESAPAQFNFNKATGGSQVPYTESDGSQWVMHKFTSGGTFTVIENPQPFKMRLIGAGGNSGYSDCPNDHGRAGGGGGWWDQDSMMGTGAFTITVGAAGSSNQGSSIQGIGHVGGGGNGCRGFYGSDWSAGTPGGWGGHSNGTAGTQCPTQYGTPGDPGSTARTLWNGEVGDWGKGGPARSHADCGANPSKGGIVAFAYRVG